MNKGSISVVLVLSFILYGCLKINSVSSTDVDSPESRLKNKYSRLRTLRDSIQHRFDSFKLLTFKQAVILDSLLDIQKKSKIKSSELTRMIFESRAMYDSFVIECEFNVPNVCNVMPTPEP